ncbi:MAG: trypsin-like peptidase domain-containing protein [Planctomycetota bacterium]
MSRAAPFERESRTQLRLTWLLLCALLAYLLSIVISPVGTLARGGDENDWDQVAHLEALERAFEGVVQRVTPSVVSIRVQRRYVVAVPGQEYSEGIGTAEQLTIINGSGTVIRSDGSILTNEHVVQSASDIEVILHDGRVLPGHVVATDARNDLAILRIGASGLPAAQYCDWSGVARGQWNVAIGNPFGLGNDGKLSVSVGVISNLGRRLPGLGQVDDRLYADMIQTTAPIHPGNSGGPLFNIRGELVGVVTAVHTRSVDDEGVGFAIPMTPERQALIKRLLAGEQIEHGYLGLTVRGLEHGESSVAGLGAGAGVLVEKVEPRGPAVAAGVTVGDIITHYDGRPVGSAMQLAQWAGQTAVGQAVELRLRRGPEPLVLHVVVDLRQISRVGWMRGGAILWRGMRLADLTVDIRVRMDTPPEAVGVVVIDIIEDSPAFQAHIHIGDVIEQVDNRNVEAIAAFLPAVRGVHGAVRLHLRGRGAVTVAP